MEVCKTMRNIWLLGQKYYFCSVFVRRCHLCLHHKIRLPPTTRNAVQIKHQNNRYERGISYQKNEES